MDKEVDSVSTDDLLRLLDEANAHPDNDGVAWRMQLAALVSGGLKAKKWTQSQLAEAADMPDHMITKIMHGDSNCTFRTAFRVLIALGIEVDLVQKSVVPVQTYTTSTTETLRPQALITDHANGKEIVFSTIPPSDDAPVWLGPWDIKDREAQRSPESSQP